MRRTSALSVMCQIGVRAKVMDWFQEYKMLVFSESTSLENIDRAISLKYENIPNILYKYRSINEYSLKNLEDDSIWLSDPKKFQ